MVINMGSNNNEARTLAAWDLLTKSFYKSLLDKVPVLANNDELTAFYLLDRKKMLYPYYTAKGL